MQIKDYKNIWVFAEHTDDNLNAVYGELLTKAYEIAQGLENDTKICGVVLGNEVSSIVEEMKGLGTEIIYSVEHEKLENYNPDYHAEVFRELIEEYKPDILLIGATSIGSELAPTVAAKVKTGLAAHCVEVALNEEKELVQMVPAFGGKVIGEILTPDVRPQMATIKPGIFTRKDLAPKENVEIVEYKSTILDDMTSNIKFLNATRKEVKGVPLEEANVVICGGFGVGSKGNWELLEELSQLIGGAAGYTRPVVDEGWTENEDKMIGTSGKTIRPKVYIGVGISGAAHHVCGMKDSDLIITINRDENAKIFDVSDYKVIGDGKRVIQFLIKEIKNRSEGILK